MKKTIISNYDVEPMIKAIAKASMRQCPEIVETNIAVRKSDGFRFSPYGSIPWDCELVANGYAYLIGGTYCGKPGKTRHELERRWFIREARNAVDFMRHLRQSTIEAITVQAEYWDIDLPLHADRPGSVMNRILSVK